MQQHQSFGLGRSSSAAVDRVLQQSEFVSSIQPVEVVVAVCARWEQQQAHLQLQPGVCAVEHVSSKFEIDCF